MERRISRLRGFTAQTDTPSGVAVSLPKVSAKWAERARNARPYGVAAISLHIATASGRHPQRGTTPLRAKRVLKGKGVIRKRGETAGVSPLVRPPRAAASFPPPAGGEIPCPLGAGTNVAPCNANTNAQGWRAEVVAQASFSWACGPIHLLAPYGAVSHTKGWAADLTGPLRLAADAAIHLPSKVRQDGWCRWRRLVTRAARPYGGKYPAHGNGSPPDHSISSGWPMRRNAASIAARPGSQSACAAAPAAAAAKRTVSGTEKPYVRA